MNEIFEFLGNHVGGKQGSIGQVLSILLHCGNHDLSSIIDADGRRG